MKTHQAYRLLRTNDLAVDIYKDKAVIHVFGQMPSKAELEAKIRKAVPVTGFFYKDRGQTFSFTLGAGEVIEGWDEGVAGMKVGGVRKLTIPSDMAYGDGGIPGVIPGGATLVFEVELISIQE